MPSFGLNLSSSGNPSFDQINSILQSYIPQVSQFYTDPSKIMGLLQGNQQRALGQAGAQGGAYAASKGLDPFAYIQRAQGGVYNEYANQQMKVPEMMSNIQQGNFGMLMHLLGLISQHGAQGEQQHSFGATMGT
jgi:hypothetical protein